MRLDPVDIAIVGAGFGGAAFAWRLSQKRPDLRILCLERGGFPDRSALPALRSDWQRAVLNEWATSPNLRLKSGRKPASADYPIDDMQSDFKPLMWNGVGGSTIAWAAHFPRLHPSDFRTRSLDGVGDDWPFSYADLEPYYDLNDAECGVSGLAGDPAYPRKPERAMPPVALGRMGMAAARGFDALGWHWWPVDAAINSRTHAGRAGCNHCGPCLIGCATGAKSSTDLTYWPKALENGVELRTGCVVQQVEIEGGRGRGIRYRDAAGRDVFQPAQIVVVAGNGIGTPRLLLASGVESPGLGRNLMFHGAAYARDLPGGARRARGAGRLRDLQSRVLRDRRSAAASSAACISRSRAKTRFSFRRRGSTSLGAKRRSTGCARNSVIQWPCSSAMRIFRKPITG